MAKNKDNKFMARALKLSKKGMGFVNPNPLVGAVIVKNGKIIGEGYHGRIGGPHAEVNAIENATSSVKGATMYVTMEPCNHFGKTPPCTKEIIKKGIEKVVIGISDPNPLVKGKGANTLIDAGIKVHTGVLEDKVAKLNEIFIKYIVEKKPWCALKTAMTLDGKIATYKGNSRWISNEMSREWVHKIRHRYSAIMVGVNTVIKDDPMLTDRSGSSELSNPVRIIVDSNGRTPLKSKVLNTENAKTIIALTERADNNFVKAIKSMGVKIIKCPEKDNKVDLPYLFDKLGKLEIDSVLLEGGSTLNFSAIQENLVDKVYSFISPKLLGGKESLTPVGGKGMEEIDKAVILNIENIKRFKEDIMVEAYIIKN